MEKILSIIIPSYNMEEYLPYCIKSLLVPSINDIEVLIINDGSKDRTLEIARDFQKEYPGSIVIVDKENGNYGSCINKGLELATGKYVKILDADDSFDNSNLEKFINFLKGNDSDLVISSYAIVDNKRSISRKVIFPYDYSNINFVKIMDTILKINLQMHAVTYRREIFKNFEYHQTEGISYTDSEWIFSPLSRIHTVSFFKDIVYLYMVGRIGQTMSFGNPTKAASDMFKMARSLIKSYLKLRPTLDMKMNYYFFALLERWIKSYYNVFIVRNRDSNIDEIVYEFDKELNSTMPEIYVYLNKQSIHKFIPFKYIQYWRNMMEKGKGGEKNKLFTIINKLI